MPLIFIRYTLALILGMRICVWISLIKIADKNIPKRRAFRVQSVIAYIVLYLLWAHIFIGLLFEWPHVLSYDSLPVLIPIGFVLACLGVAVALWGRLSLGNNWAHGGEYQIKEHQTLTTSGIYRYIRHPIYTGLFLMLVGSLLVIQSYIVFIYVLIAPLSMIHQASKEEKLLVSYFGDTYREYMRTSKRFIPFIY